MSKRGNPGNPRGHVGARAAIRRWRGASAGSARPRRSYAKAAATHLLAEEAASFGPTLAATANGNHDGLTHGLAQLVSGPAFLLSGGMSMAVECNSVSVPLFNPVLGQPVLGQMLGLGAATSAAAEVATTAELAPPVTPASGKSLQLSQKLVMQTEDFNTRYAATLANLWAGVENRYEVKQAEFQTRVQAVFAKISKGEAKADSQTDFTEQLLTLRAGELCLALACEKGDELAWRYFEREYRHGMQAAGRALTRDEAEAEDLTQFVFGELYGVRLDGERRLSKLQHYSGRGSLGGWLRAVIYQAFIDRKRQTARFEQVEEVAEFDRLANASHEVLNGQNGHHVSLHAPIVQPDDLEDTRLRHATEEAMGQAFAALEPKDRLLLNYYFFDSLTLREIGLLLNVHEATISRWLAKAQKQVKKKTEEFLQRTYGLRRAEIAECLELAARSEIDVRKLLGEATGVLAQRAP